MSIENVPGGRPLPRHAPLWRYMKISSFFMLLEGKAFFPAVATLQSADPLEGDLIPAPEWLMSKLGEACHGRIKELENWLLDKMNDWEKKAVAPDLNEGHMRTRSLAEVYIRELRKRRAVWCWLNAHHESAGMWSVYGHAGIAVRTQFEALEQSLPPSLNFQIARIAYANRNATSSLSYFNPEALQNQELIHRPHLVKGQEYEHENEIRVTTICSPNERGRLVTGIRQGSLIKEVVISPLLPFEEAEAIELQVKQHKCWESCPPKIRRSSILGGIAKEEESMAALDNLANAQGISSHCEPDLPPPLDEL